MSHVIDSLDAPSSYRDSRSSQSRQAQVALLAETTQLYIGNLSFYTTEEQMYELFSKACDPSKGGGIRRIIMGLDRNNKTPCGFAFVEYYTHAEAVECMRLISGTKLDERIIRCDLDPGYVDGRQYGRGRSGGQVRDEYRQDYDAGRGGWGHLRLKEEEERKRAEAMEIQRRKDHEEVYAEQEREDGGRVIPTGAEGQYEEMEGAQRAGDASFAEGGNKRDRSEDGDDDDRGASSKNARFREEREDDDDDDE